MKTLIRDRTRVYELQEDGHVELRAMLKDGAFAAFTTVLEDQAMSIGRTFVEVRIYTLDQEGR